MDPDAPIKVNNNLKPAEFLRAEAELVLDEARRQKAEKNKDLGEPIKLQGVPIDIKIRGRHIWIAENTAIARKMDLETGRTLQIYRGHFGPVTCIALCDRVAGSGDGKILITGSWDQTIKLWDTDTKALISSTPAHEDFVKVLLVIPSLNLLVSGSSDKVVRFWDLSSPSSSEPLPSLGSISAHTRPVEALDVHISPDGDSKSSVVLFTADTMGMIKAWDLSRQGGDRPIWRSTLRDDLGYHRTRVNELMYGDGHLWTASSDETIQIYQYPPPPSSQKQPKPVPPITHPTGFRAVLPLPIHPQLDADAFPYLLGGSGDLIRVYDISSLEEPEFIREVEGHWHDVTHLRVWLRDRKGGKGKEVWIVSASLDGTIRKWRLADIVVPPKPIPEEKKEATAAVPPPKAEGAFEMTEEEERELAELMEDD